MPLQPLENPVNTIVPVPGEYKRAPLTPEELEKIFKDCPELLKYYVPCTDACLEEGMCVHCNEYPDPIRQAQWNLMISRMPKLPDDFSPEAGSE